eukprot:scaffold1744_cov340-Prasinococcus_capsulatus_cf.AAC.19
MRLGWAPPLYVYMRSAHGATTAAPPQQARHGAIRRRRATAVQVCAPRAPRAVASALFPTRKRSFEMLEEGPYPWKPPNGALHAVARCGVGLIVRRAAAKRATQSTPPKSARKN